MLILRDRITTKMSDDEFFWFCQENKDLRIERNAQLEILIMSPVTSLSGYHSGEIYRQLANWSIADGKGIAFDSSAGFLLPDRSVLSPDASWIAKESWQKLTQDEKDRFAPICPDFVIEVRSKSDELDQLIKKMQTWLSNGAKLAWLIDPRDSKTYIFRQGKNHEIIEGLQQKIQGEGPVKGLELDLSPLSLT